MIGKYYLWMPVCKARFLVETHWHTIR